MAVLENLTPFGVFSSPTVTRDGDEVWLVCLAAHFQLPEPGATVTSLVPCKDQPPPPLADEYWGDPAESGLKVEGQGTWHRPGTDIYLVGQAWAPGRQPSIAVKVRLRVGTVELATVVIGDRRWQRRLLGEVTISEPEPFVSLPLQWERAFGGAWSPPPGKKGKPLWESRNPVGRGLYPDATAADGQHLPNVERLDQRIESLSDRPLPVGYSPVARHWEPRRPLGGTFDDEWTEKRAPFWPADLDERFFCAAPTELQSRQFLQGGEPVELEGAHPDGHLLFSLPRLSFSLRTEMGRQTDRRALNLDGVEIRSDEGRISLYYRAAVPAPQGVLALKSCWVRQLESWELA
jgi:hypothetical protein